jgi:hypothetical protein
MFSTVTVVRSAGPLTTIETERFITLYILSQYFDMNGLIQLRLTDRTR